MWKKYDENDKIQISVATKLFVTKLIVIIRFTPFERDNWDFKEKNE